ncbi:MAG TPA: alpha-2-macroglobulin family protein, partial [Puia sp.]|nr:alpha-2-macroglobulin family protein [Puia sp.]
RNSSIPYPLFTRWPRPESNTEITHGEIKTNRDGIFDLEFIAAPDLSVTKENSLIFNYQVIADVTDINGETRTGETTVSVGYQSMTLDIELPEESMPADQFRHVSIRTQNLNNKFQSTDVRLSIYRLSAPERLIRNRYWSRPDQFVMSKDEYLTNFPHDEYDDEKNITTWSRKEKIVELSDSTKPGKLFQWQGTLFLKGWYAIVATTHDKYGEQVSNTKFIQLFDPATGDPGVPQYVWFDVSTQKVEPGFYAIPRIGSSAKDLFVIKNIDSGKSKNDPSYQYLKISNERKTDQIFVSEAMRGGFGIYYCFIKNNRFFTSTNQIIVPWTNKELKIEYETFRDKSLPGSEEKWKIKVSGAKANPVAAEALASMYDASLNQIKPHQWLYPDIFPTYSMNNIWRGDISFSITASFDRYRENYLRKYFTKKYDKLIQFQSRQYERKIMYSYANVGPTPAPMALEDSGEVVFHKVDLTDRFKTGTTTNYVEKKVATPNIVRKNFNETAFFYPNLLTDSSGAISFSFTLPEALTQWRSMIFAHTKDLVMGYAEKTIVTQKSLMVQPNAPRFLREGDHVELSTKIVNMTDSEMTGQIHLQMIDPETNQPVDSHFANSIANQYFTIAPRQSAQINFPLEVPFQYNQPISYRIVAQSTSYSDGEEATLPVLPNRTLVTESIPLAMQGTGKKNFRFDQLLESGKSESLT